MVSIITHSENRRLQYICDHIFSTILKIPYKIITDEDKQGKFKEEFIISYGIKNVASDLFIPKESDLLFEDNYSEKSFHQFLNNYKEDGFSLSFALLTRYQEYLPFDGDKHGRFPFKADLLFQKLEVERAWVDEFALKIEERIKSKFPTFNSRKSEYKTLCTVDIDRVWKYKGSSKGVLFLKSLIYKFKKDYPNTESLFSYMKTGKDPYNTFNYIEDCCEKYDVPLQYFILLSENSSSFDNNIAINNLEQKEFLHSLSKRHSLGIHPSYASKNQEEIIREEKETLETITAQKIEKSRQHYILLNFPETYRALIKAGITKDYSMGFADQIGFRSGTSYPFKWYDLSTNQVTDLQVFPFCIMDVSLKNYLHLNIEDAIKKAEELKQRVKEYGGYFIPIFHNQNLNDEGEWEGWKKIMDILRPI